jgi:hypothetical protein
LRRQILRRFCGAAKRGFGSESFSYRIRDEQVFDPKQQKKLDQVFFGATVTYADGRGNVKTIASSGSMRPISVAVRIRIRRRISPIFLPAPAARVLPESFSSQSLCPG